MNTFLLGTEIDQHLGIKTDLFLYLKRIYASFFQNIFFFCRVTNIGACFRIKHRNTKMVLEFTVVYNMILN